MLTTVGVGKRDNVDQSVAKTYVEQVSLMITCPNDLSSPKQVYQNVTVNMAESTVNTTKYTYYTSRNFLTI